MRKYSAASFVRFELRLSVNGFQNWQPEDLELADNQSKSFLLSWWDYIHKWPGEPVERKKPFSDNVEIY